MIFTTKFIGMMIFAGLQAECQQAMGPCLQTFNASQRVEAIIFNQTRANRSQVKITFCHFPTLWLLVFFSILLVHTFLSAGGLIIFSHYQFRESLGLYHFIICSHLKLWHFQLKLCCKDARTNNDHRHILDIIQG